jgi:hypothetical protein
MDSTARGVIVDLHVRSAVLQAPMTQVVAVWVAGTHWQAVSPAPQVVTEAMAAKIHGCYVIMSKWDSMGMGGMPLIGCRKTYSAGWDISDGVGSVGTGGNGRKGKDSE